MRVQGLPEVGRLPAGARLGLFLGHLRKDRGKAALGYRL